MSDHWITIGTTGPLHKPWQRTLKARWLGDPISGAFRPALRRQHLRWWDTVCHATGCKRQGRACWYSVQEPAVYYCSKHDSGFCPGCGVFWAGVESFDFSRSGFCENCEAEFDDGDDGDGDPFDDAYDYWDNY